MAGVYLFRRDSVLMKRNIYRYLVFLSVNVVANLRGNLVCRVFGLKFSIVDSFAHVSKSCSKGFAEAHSYYLQVEIYYV